MFAENPELLPEEQKMSSRKKGYNKAILIEQLATKAGITKKDASKVLHMFVSLLEEGVLDHKKIVLSDFGVFQMTSRKAFQGYDPVNDCKINVPQRFVAAFKAGRGLKIALNPTLAAEEKEQ
tara:strand:+ start:206 stop:571 length:366 start_codon:yes stop_codon:yes gene_type:complete